MENERKIKYEIADRRAFRKFQICLGVTIGLLVCAIIFATLGFGAYIYQGTDIAALGKQPGLTLIGFDETSSNAGQEITNPSASDGSVGAFINPFVQDYAVRLFLGSCSVLCITACMILVMCAIFYYIAAAKVPQKGKFAEVESPPKTAPTKQLNLQITP